MKPLITQNDRIIYQITQILIKSQELLDFMSNYNYYSESRLPLASPKNHSYSSPVEKHVLCQERLKELSERLINDLEADINKQGFNYTVRLNIKNNNDII